MLAIVNIVELKSYHGNGEWCIMGYVSNKDADIARFRLQCTL